MTARRLHALGAIDELAEPGGGAAAASALGDALARGPSAVHGRIKALLRAAAGSSLEAQLDRERDAMADAVAAPEGGEGIAAFLGKRAPDFVALRESPGHGVPSAGDVPPREP